MTEKENILFYSIAVGKTHFPSSPRKRPSWKAGDRTVETCLPVWCPSNSSFFHILNSHVMLICIYEPFNSHTHTHTHSFFLEWVCVMGMYTMPVHQTFLLHFLLLILSPSSFILPFELYNSGPLTLQISGYTADGHDLLPTYQTYQPAIWVGWEGRCDYYPMYGWQEDSLWVGNRKRTRW